MSKFFGEGNNSSDSEDNRSENGSEDGNAKKVNPSYDYDLDPFKTDDKKRVVQSESQRFKGPLKKSIHAVNATMKNHDFTKSWDNFQQILKIVEKHKKLIEKDGYPNFLILFLIKINQQINAVTNQEKKKLKGNAATAFNTMKRQFKNKIIPNYQKQFQRIEEEGIKQEEQMMNEQQNQQESSESEEDDRQLLKSEDPMVRRRYWLKKEIRKDLDIKEQKKEGQRKKDDKQQKEEIDETKEKKKKKINIIQKKQKKARIGVTSKEAEDQMRSMIKNFYRLKKQDEREDYLETLNNIIKSSSKYQDNQKLSFLLADIPIRIEVSRQMRTTHFERSRWLEIFNHTVKCFSIMRQSEQQDLMDNILQFSQTNEATQITTSEASIYNSIKYFVMSLESELRKAFIYIDNNEVEFSERLQDLIKFIDFMYKFCQDMSFKEELQKSASQLAYKVIENMYFMSSSFMNKIKNQFKQDFTFIELEDGNKLQQFAQPILKYQPEEEVTKTILYLVYNHAVNYRPKAKDLLVMSNVPDIIGKCDYYTQALYNRAIVTIGISAFKNGNLFEVQQYLSEICGYAKQKQQCKQMLREFLAQGSRSNPDIPRSKILPYYLHLNCEMIECLQLIATMILEIPYLLNENGRITSKTFKKLISQYEKSHFIAQPIHNKDLIYAASNDLKTAQWQKCFNRLMQLNIWKQMNCLDEIKINLLSNIKQQALKCYLVGNRKTFTSISLGNLTTKFALSLPVVKKLVCKWIYNNELKAYITDDGYLRMIQKKQSEMQKVCEDLYSKLEQVMKIHEGIFDNQLSSLIDEQDAEKQMRLQRRFSIPLTQKIKAVLNKRG